MRELELGSEDKAFVVVGVIRTEGPTAIKAGNKAIILSDGTIEGWVGGHCTEEEIVSNSLECLKDGTSRSLNLTTCQGGRMDVYLEPYLPKRKLVIFGHVPIVRALSRLAHALNFSVIVVDKQGTKDKFPDADVVLGSLEDFKVQKMTSHTFAVVATMGEFDQEYVEQLSALSVPYIGVVAGKKRASELIAYLRKKNLSEEQLSRIKSPAGIYIRAVTAEEIALSIIAEIVEFARANNDLREYSHKGQQSEPLSTMRSMPDTIEVAVDPVCGMTVEKTSSFHFEFNGENVFFCSEACEEAFKSNPRKYVLEQNQ